MEQEPNPLGIILSIVVFGLIVFAFVSMIMVNMRALDVLDKL